MSKEQVREVISSSDVVYVSPEDKVVSEVNPFLCPVTDVKPIQKSSSKQTTKLSDCKYFWEAVVLPILPNIMECLIYKNIIFRQNRKVGSFSS
jgi:hypothetical protein